MRNIILVLEDARKAIVVVVVECQPANSSTEQPIPACHISPVTQRSAYWFFQYHERPYTTFLETEVHASFAARSEHKFAFLAFDMQDLVL